MAALRIGADYVPIRKTLRLLSLLRRTRWRTSRVAWRAARPPESIIRLKQSPLAPVDCFASLAMTSNHPLFG